MSTVLYEFANTAHLHKGALRDAQVVGEHLDLLRQQTEGELTPEAVVDDAANPNSPLHSHFEWDDTEAARQHRLSQARKLIRAVVAVFEGGDEAVKTPAFVHIRERGDPHYREVRHAMSEADTRVAVVQRALKELQAWQRRYQSLSEFAAVFAAASKAKKGLSAPAKR